MDFVSETPAGVKDGVNVTFTLSMAPTANSTLGVLNNQPQHKSAGAPVAGEYGLSGMTVTMGLAPNSSDELVFMYEST
jgi:hypothetical protein